MSQIQAKVIEDSISEDRNRLTTLQLSYPRMIHSEFMTHRVFSRNASSSRAIPVAKMIAQVWNDPAMPVHWGKNQPGMQAREELTGIKLSVAKFAWRTAAKAAASIAWVMNKVGLHKQVANRILEPFQIIHVIVTSSKWGNFFDLRHHVDADPNIFNLADAMRCAIASSIPVSRGDNSFSAHNWHLPYVTPAERAKHTIDPLYLAKLSAARCARVSYLTHDGKEPDPEKDLALYERLVGSRPLHASPVEHQAYPDRHPVGEREGWMAPEKHGNFDGWCQYRKMVERTVG